MAPLFRCAGGTPKKTGRNCPGTSQNSVPLHMFTPLEYSGSVCVAGLLFRKLSIFWSFRAFYDKTH